VLDPIFENLRGVSGKKALTGLQETIRYRFDGVTQGEEVEGRQITKTLNDRRAGCRRRKHYYSEKIRGGSLRKQGLALGADVGRLKVRILQDFNNWVSKPVRWTRGGPRAA